MRGGRRGIPARKSKRIFTRGAERVHPKNNMDPRVMRGGIRL